MEGLADWESIPNLQEAVPCTVCGPFRQEPSNALKGDDVRGFFEPPVHSEARGW